MPDTVFQYWRSTARYREVGDPDGDAWTFYDDGTVVHTYYAVGYKDPVRTIAVAESVELADALREYIDAHDAVIKAIPVSLNNGSLDGYYDIFTFGDHRITGINVTEKDPEAMKSEDPFYAERYAENMVQEAQLVAVFRELYGIIRHYLPEVHIRIRSAGIE